MAALALTHSPADIARRVLIDLGLGAAPPGTWPIYAASEPDLPDNCITVLDTDGMSKARLMAGDPVTDFGIMIRVRADRGEVAYPKAEEIRRGMATVRMSSITFGGAEYMVHCFNRIGAVRSIGSAPGGADRRQTCTINPMISLKRLS